MIEVTINNTIVSIYWLIAIFIPWVLGIWWISGVIEEMICSELDKIIGKRG